MKYIHLDTDVKLTKELTKTVKLSDKEFLVASEPAKDSTMVDNIDVENKQVPATAPSRAFDAVSSLPWDIIKPVAFFLSGILLMIFFFHGLR